MEQPPDQNPRPFGGAPLPKKEEEERKGGGLPFFGGAGEGTFAYISSLGVPKLIAGVLALCVAGGVGVKTVLDNQKAEGEKTAAAAKKKLEGHGFATRAVSQSVNPNAGRSSLGFAAADEKKGAYLGDPGAVRDEGATDGGEAPGRYSNDAPDAPPTQTGGRGASRGGGRKYAQRPNLPSQMSNKLSQGRQFGSLTGKGGNFFKKGKGGRSDERRKDKQPNPNDFEDRRRQDLEAMRLGVNKKLKTKHIAKTVKAGKSIAQLKRSGDRSARAKQSVKDTAGRGYADQAFTQRQGNLDNIEIKTPESSTGGDGAPTGPEIDGGAYSVQKGQYLQDEDGGCPEGMMPVASGGCEPVHTGGDEKASSYADLVAEAWNKVERARKAAQRLDLSTANELSKEAEEIGLQIRDEYGQTMQGDIIKYWADRSNEMTHWEKGEKRAKQKRRKYMDPKLDEDVHKAMRESRNEDYQKQ